MQLVPISPDNSKEAEECIKRFGSTSDHNLRWFVNSVISPEGEPVFAVWPDGTGLLAHRYPDKFRIWSDPLCPAPEMAGKISEFTNKVFEAGDIKEVWCDDVSDSIYPALKRTTLKLEPIYYTLLWPVLDMSRFDLTLPGGNFKEMRNARSKFSREHKLEFVDAKKSDKDGLHKVVEGWKKVVSKKPDIYDSKYHNAIANNFKGFLTARVLNVDGRPVGFNAGYEVPNKSGRFAGVIGIHDYSLNDLGVILWLEDLEWIKNAGYKELDMQGSEDDGGLKLKLRFGAVVERKTDTFCIKRG